MTQAAEIVGTVEYREGDGPNITIRPGPIEVEITATDATLGWTEGEARGSTAMPLADFKRYVAEGAIVLHTPVDDSAAPAR
jgi:hypothetical protein